MNTFYQFTLDGGAHFYSTKEDGEKIVAEINWRRAEMNKEPHEVKMTPISIAKFDEFFD